MILQVHSGSVSWGLLISLEQADDVGNSLGFAQSLVEARPSRQVPISNPF